MNLLHQLILKPLLPQRAAEFAVDEEAAGQMILLTVNFTGADAFRNAGYAPLQVGEEHLGDVRQSGNFTFVRVFDAGHAIPFYQPEAAFTIFNRTLLGLDIATGQQKISDDYHTEGPAESAYSQRDLSQPGSKLVRSAKFARSIHP